jgi:hypothetical protein
MSIPYLFEGYGTTETFKYILLFYIVINNVGSAELFFQMPIIKETFRNDFNWINCNNREVFVKNFLITAIIHIKN